MDVGEKWVIVCGYVRDEAENEVQEKKRKAKKKRGRRSKKGGVQHEDFPGGHPS